MYLICDHKLTWRSEQSRRNYSQLRCLFKSLLLFDLQARHHASSRQRSNLLNRHLGRTLNILPMHTCFSGRPQLNKHHELQAPFLRSKCSLDDTRINTALVCQYQAPFPVLLHLCSTTQTALLCRAAAFPHTIRIPSETPLSLTPSRPLH